MKQKFKNLSTTCDASLVLMIRSFIIIGIPVTIEFLSSLRCSFQLLAMKNKIKTMTKKLKK